MALSSEFIKGAGLMASIKSMQADVKKDLPNLVAFGNNVDSLEEIDADLTKAAKEMSTAIQAYTKYYDTYKELEKNVSTSLGTYDKAVKAFVKDGRNHAEKEYETACGAMEQGLDSIDKRVDKMKKFWAPPPKWA